MALTKCFVILFLVYLNFDISPLNSAAIPERLDSPDSISENDENSELYTTTGATEEDIGKIFETYENVYIKNSNWLNDDEQTNNENSEKLLQTQPDEESTSRDIETTEPTADDVVESIHNIMDEKIDTKKNRTDRTIVVVVTTNVFHVNGSDDANKRQHTLLSFGTPGMIHKETSTDATLAIHNKITTEFFNSNPSPIAEQAGTLQINQKSIAERNENIELDDSDDATENLSHVTEEEPDVSTTVQPGSDNDSDPESKIDILQLDDTDDIQSANLNAVSEGRSFDDELTNDDSNDVLKIMKVIPNRIVDEPISLSKPFEIPIQEPQDSSLMEAIENILDTDVRKAFERDIPQTRHVPLDINIEEETLYAPLKDLSEYIVEEVPISGNYDIFSDNVEEVESSGKIEKSQDMKASDYFTVSDNLKHEAATDIEHKTTTLTTDQPTIASITEETTTTSTTITVEEETGTVVTEAPSVFKEPTSPTTVREDVETTNTTDEPESNAANEKIENEDENEGFISTPTSAHYTLKALAADNQIEKLNEESLEQVEPLQRSNLLESPVLHEHGESSTSDNYVATDSIVENQKAPETLLISNIDDQPAPITDNINEVPDEKLGEENPERVETLQRNNLLESSALFDQDETSNSDNYENETTDSTAENQSELQDKVPEPTTASADPQETFVTESLLPVRAENQLQHTADDTNHSLIGSFKRLVDNSFDQYPTYVQLDTTTEYVTNPNFYIGASFSGEQVAAKLEEAERAKAAKTVQILSSIPENDEFPSEEDPVNAQPTSFINAVFAEGVVAAFIEDAKLKKTNSETINFIEVLASTTTKPAVEDVVREVVRADEETTEQHQIIKKPGVGDTVVELKTIERNHLLASKTAHFEGRSFSDNDDAPVDPLRTLVEAVELTADITKSVDNFQGFSDSNDSIPFAANQVIENKDDMALVKDDRELNITEASSVWCVYVYVVCGVLSTGLIVLLGIVSYLRFRQFKRNILFSC